jgi:hypothetical protein
MTDDVFKSYGADTFGANDFVGDVYLIGDRHLFVDAELADPIFFARSAISVANRQRQASFQTGLYPSDKGRRELINPARPERHLS